MKLRRLKNGKLSIQFLKSDTVMRSGEWYSDGHILVHVDFVDRVKSNYDLDSDFYCTPYRPSSRAAVVNVNPIVDRRKAAEEYAYPTKLLHKAHDWVSRIFTRGGSYIYIHEGYYQPFKADHTFKRCNRDGCSPVFVYNKANTLVAVVTPMIIDDPAQLGEIY